MCINIRRPHLLINFMSLNINNWCFSIILLHLYLSVQCHAYSLVTSKKWLKETGEKSRKPLPYDEFLFVLCYLHSILVLAIVLEIKSWFLKVYIVTYNAILLLRIIFKKWYAKNCFCTALKHELVSSKSVKKK